MTDPKGTWSDGGKVWNGEPMQSATICPHCHATVLSTSQPELVATQEYFLRAMAKNYAGGHYWDRLDSETCVMAADEIAALRAALAATPAVGGEPNGVLVDACMRLQAFLDTFGDVGGCETQADLNDWLAAQPASPLRTVDVVARCMEILEDVPGEHLIDRVHRIVDWHHQLSEQYHDRPASPLRGRGACIECGTCDPCDEDCPNYWGAEAASPPEQPAAVKMYPMNLAPKDKEIIGQDTDGRVFNLRWDPDDCGENWYDVHGDQMAHPVRWMLMP